MRDRSWSRVRRRVRMAARFARRRELRNFHARIVGIVDVQAALTVAPNSRPGNLLRSILAKLLSSRLYVPHAKRKMILRPKRLVIGSRRNVQHVLNPVVTIRNLQLVPIKPIVLHAALPVQLEAKHVAIKTIFRRYVFDYESRV